MNELIDMNIPVVITIQRFNSRQSMLKYTNGKDYKHSCSRFRLTGSELNKIENLVAAHQEKGKPLYICDQKGTGCGGCGLCSKLTTGEDLKISSLNLSSSGICKYNCPDCYAKTMQNFAVKLGYKPIVYDTIKQNDKQAGKTTHIKNNTKGVK
jgi:hypothetical protein